MTPKPAAHVCKHGLCDHKEQCNCAECQPRAAPTPTPTPWFARIDNKNEKVDILTVEKPIKDDEENLRECIACVFDKANAAFIVRAVNSHEELLKAAKSLLSVAESWIHDQLDGTSSLQSALDELEDDRQAIASAETQ